MVLKFFKILQQNLAILKKKLRTLLYLEDRFCSVTSDSFIRHEDFVFFVVGRNNAPSIETHSLIQI